MRSFRFRPFVVSSRAWGADPEATLSADHPLVGVQRAARTTADQIRAVAVAQAAGLGALVQEANWGPALLGAATLVQLCLAMRLLVLVETRHDLCRELVRVRFLLVGDEH